MFSYVLASISVSIVSERIRAHIGESTYKVLFRQVTGIRSPVLHGLISAAGSANAVLRDWKKATNAISAGGIRGMLGGCVDVNVWREIILSFTHGVRW